ncbi:conserved hypothetical protein [Pyrenophora tritici-repentis Pt-1C-BFP]|uniref:Aminoglycoside phosphotransferase domain-containing protein n=1 Tax=Pyrenophora tritici-repentis (strain Pt-1C-BFP) TaxID=426418 RepID=B2W9W0_PYRTR|nr:uncharacterized protein PTRG_06768 [Pyrenophora tritici-repentis Pt-1C-BFP]EDU49688.1 conserved hypothetical protein [Pyrenophora tritici-repentis Pt-1C-BFP]
MTTPENMPNCYRLSSDVQFEESPDFEKFNYFNCNRPASSYPSPAEVRENPLLRRSWGSYTTKFDSLNLVVKYGKDITASEAHCLEALRRLLPDEVPVPKWESLSEEAKKEVCKQLRSMVNSLRKLEQDPSDQFVGRIDRKPLLDVVFTDGVKPPAGPFNTAKEFHDWLSVLFKEPGKLHFPDPFRGSLPDNSRIVFTHADLHPSNIMVSANGSSHVLAIIDWHQSGWYPEYWEYCKALYTADFTKEWALEYVPQFVNVVEFFEDWLWYPRSMGYS